MIGIALFAALMIAEIVRFFKNDEYFDGIMMLARPVVLFLSALLCGGTFWGSLCFGVGGGFIGLVVSFLLTEYFGDFASGETYTPSDDESDDGDGENEEDKFGGKGKTGEEDKSGQKGKTGEEDKSGQKGKTGEEDKSGKKCESDKGKKTDEKKKSDDQNKGKKEPAPPAKPVYRSDIFEISGTRLIKCKEYHDYIRIPQGITVIAEKAFCNHTWLRGVIFPDTLKTIEAYAFRNCAQIEELNFPEGLEAIGKGAFFHCRSIKKVRFPKSLKYLDGIAFSDCTELTAVSFAEGCEAVVDRGFINCHKLLEYTIPATVNLEEVSYTTFFPKYDERITVRCYAGSRAFFEAKRVGATCVFLDGKEYDASGDFVIEEGVLKKYTGNNAEVIIPEGTKAIYRNAFRANEHIIRVEIPDSVATIGSGAFELCGDLRYVRLPSGLRHIPAQCFNSCYDLAWITLPKTITTIRKGAFRFSGLVAVQLPEGIKSIQNEAFAYCSKLYSLDIPASAYVIDEIAYDSPCVTIIAKPDSAAARYAQEKGISVRSPDSDLRTGRVLRSEELPGGVRRTCYETLDPDSKRVYVQVLMALMRMDRQYDFWGICFEKINLGQIATALETDWPEIFWVDWSIGVAFNIHSVSYSITKEQRDQIQQQIDTLVKPFVESIPPDLGDYEKAKRVYEWLASVMEYDRAGLLEQKECRFDSVTNDDLRNIYGAFVKKKAVCVGYAKAYAYTLHAMGIECTVRYSMTHAWACAKLEGNYYHIDVTWGDKKVLDYSYFGLTDDEMHELQNSLDPQTEYIVCNATRCNYYAKEWLYPQKVDKEDLLYDIGEYIAVHRCEEVKIKFPDMLMRERAMACLEEDGTLRWLARKLGFNTAYATKNSDKRLITVRFI